MSPILILDCERAVQNALEALLLSDPSPTEAEPMPPAEPLPVSEPAPERSYYGFDDFLTFGLLPADTPRPVDVVHPNPDAEYAALIAQIEAWARLPAAAFTGHL